MVATIGLSQVLFLLTALPFVRPKKLSHPFPVPIDWSFSVGGFVFTPGQVLALIVAPIVALSVAAFIRYSRWGLAMRAMSENAGLGAALRRLGAPHLDGRVDARRRAVGVHRDPERAGPDERPHRGAEPRPAGARSHRRSGRRDDEPHGRLRRRRRSRGRRRGPQLEHHEPGHRGADPLRAAPRRAAPPGRGPPEGDPEGRSVHLAPRRGRSATTHRRVPPPGRHLGRRHPRRGRRAAPAGAQPGSLVPVVADLHLRRGRAVPPGPHRLGRTGVARPVRSRRRRGDHGRAPRRQRAARAAHALRRRGHGGGGGDRRVAGPARPWSLPRREHARVRPLHAAGGARDAVRDAARDQQDRVHRPPGSAVDVDLAPRPVRPRPLVGAAPSRGSRSPCSSSPS